MRFSFRVDDVAEEHQVIRIVSEIHLPQVALVIIVSSGDAEFFSKLPGDWSHLRKIHGRHARLRNRSEEHTSELQSQSNLVCRLLLEKKKKLAGAGFMTPMG